MAPEDIFVPVKASMMSLARCTEMPARYISMRASSKDDIIVIFGKQFSPQ